MDTNKPNRRESLANTFNINQLKIALDNYKPRNNVSGIKNGMFSSGTGEKYTRIRINGVKVRRSHMVWRVNTNKKIPVGFNIHHKDENKRNDDFKNLELVDAIGHGIENLRNVKMGGGENS